MSAATCRSGEARRAQEDGLDIWLCGGATLAGQLVEEIDEFHLKVNPLLLGEPRPLLDGYRGRLPLELVSSRDLGGVLLTVDTATGDRASTGSTTPIGSAPPDVVDGGVRPS